jgi:hypothetical protein
MSKINEIAVGENVEQSLREYFRYDDTTGRFYWIKNKHRATAGSLAGTLSNEGYLMLTLSRKKYSAHRVAWLFANGHWPKQHIDHINGIRSDNRICNLRDVSNKENLHNIRGPYSSNKTSKYLGVHFCKTSKKWVSQIHANGKKTKIGQYDCEELAHESYIAEKRRVHHGFIG